MFLRERYVKYEEPATNESFFLPGLSLRLSQILRYIIKKETIATNCDWILKVDYSKIKGKKTILIKPWLQTVIVP